MLQWKLLICVATASVLGLALVVTAAPEPATAPQRTMYARSSAVVRNGRTFSAAALARLKQGDAVQLLATEGRYYQVKVGDVTGWVYRNKLAADKPEDVADLLAGSPNSGSIELSELEAGGALRGLSPLAEDYAKAENVPPWAVQAVEAMGSRAVKPEDLELFQKQGKLGEYGEEVGP